MNYLLVFFFFWAEPAEDRYRVAFGGSYDTLERCEEMRKTISTKRRVIVYSECRPIPGVK